MAGSEPASAQTPGGQQELFQDSEFIIMAVGGPNSRRDFHHDPSEEFFYQLEGDILLKTVQHGRLIDVPHPGGRGVPSACGKCPTRPSAPPAASGSSSNAAAVPTSWMASRGIASIAGIVLYLERVAVRNIETQLPEIFSRFYSSVANRTCGVCATVMQAPIQ